MRNLFIAAMILVVHCATAQVNYQPGYIVKVPGDSLRGFIDNRNWSTNPKTIRFKKTESDNASNYTVNDLVAFGIDKADQYVKAIVEKDMRPVNADNNLMGTADSALVDTVFLRVLVRGRLGLYGLTDIKNHFYISEDNAHYTELLYRVFMERFTTKYTESHGYRNQLMNYLPATNQQRLAKKIENVTYTESQLTSLVYDINMQFGSAALPATVAVKQKTQVSLYVAAGVAYSNVALKGTREQLTDLSFTGSLQPVIGAGADIVAARGLKRFVIRGEIAWQKRKYSGHGDASTGIPAYIKSIQYDIEASDIMPSVAILYNVCNRPADKVYLGAGFAINISHYSSNRHVANWQDGTPSRVTEKFVPFESVWGGFLAKAGYIYKNKFEIGANIKLWGAAEKNLSYSITPHTYSGMLAWHFN